MAEMDQGLIEKYQGMLLKDPTSKVFAPLVEAYRKMGWLKEARETCEQGLHHNPHFAGGYVAMAKVAIDEEKHEEASLHLQKAVDLSPENLLAHQLLAESYLRLKMAKEALRSYKMVLFLNPENEKAKKAVKRLESLTADEYEDDLFSMQPLGRAARKIENDEAPLLEPIKPAPLNKPLSSKNLERYLSLADAFMVRGDHDKAFSTLEEAQRDFGDLKEIVKRFRLLQSHTEPESPSDDKTYQSKPPNRADLAAQEKIQFLEGMLRRIKSYDPQA